MRPHLLLGSSIVLVSVAANPGPALAQEAITGPLTRVDLSGYQGDGLVADPGPGQLDSDAWRVRGMNEGDGEFGGDFDFGDFAEGASNGGVSGDGTGGLWAFSTTPGDPGFGFQQVGDDLTPGEIFLRFVNASGAPLVDPTVRFEAWIFNDSTRASEMDFAWSIDGGDSFENVPGARVTTPQSPDAVPTWQLEAREVALDGVTIAAGGELQLRWRPDYLSGSGGYDELAIDDIETAKLVPDWDAVMAGKSGIGPKLDKPIKPGHRPSSKPKKNKQQTKEQG